jgi:cobalt-zinc-cadmium efflux system outer membrane protein
VAGIAIAGQAPNPTLSYSANSISTRTGVGAGSWRDKRMDQTLALSQLIERGDKRQLRTGNATALAQAARADLVDVRRQQRLALYQAFFDLQAAQEKWRLLAETAGLYEKSIDAAALRLKAGDLAAADLSRLRVEALRARNDERAAQAELARARQTLGYLIGEEQSAESLVADEPWPAAEPSNGPAPPVERRADVVAAQARVDAAQRGRELARSATTRDITVGAQVERFPPEAGVTYGISLSLPLFVRYAYEGEIARAESDYTAAVEAREAVVARARGETANAAADLAAAVERRRRAEAEALPEARRVADAAEFAYRKGAASLTDLLDARRTLRAVELDTVAALAEQAKALAGWRAVTEWEMTKP